MAVRPLPLAALALFLIGCAATPPRSSSEPLAVAIEAPRDYAADNLNATLWSQRSIEHDLVYLGVYRAAQDALVRALEDPTWDALPHGERHNALAGLAPAIVLDIDETVLDNSPYAARMIRTGRAYQAASWDAWVREEAATPLAGALEYTRFAAAQGVRVIYITNREEAQRAPTLANLRRAGFPVADEGVYLGLGFEVAGCIGKPADKGCRRRKVAESYRVLAQVGDQIGDFIDITDAGADALATRLAPYARWIGERWFVLPNPTYGSWEAVPFGGDWSLPADTRHRLKLEALRVE